jgi:hypothetical protein
MRPVKMRSRTLEDFWISAYSGNFVGEEMVFQLRGFALAEYLGLLDELYYEGSWTEDELGREDSPLRETRHRRSAVAGMSGVPDFAGR